jgi:hypothetical protein
MRYVLKTILGALYAISAFAQVSDFQLTDVSALSPRRGTVVSPRDYILQVSGFYFGGAT